MATGIQSDINKNSVMVIAKCAEITELIKGFTKEFEGGHNLLKMDYIIAALQKEAEELKKMVE